MTDEQTKHVIGIIEDFKDKCFTKYRLGAQEHGGDIWNMPALKLIEAGMEEAIDQYVYLYTLKEKEVERLRKLDEQRRTQQ